MKSTAKKLAVCAAALCLLACGTAVSAAAASPVSGLALSGVAMPWDQDVPAESIEAGSYTANMLLGSSQQLSPVVRPRNSTDSVVFISDDTSILTVSNSGVVQAVGVGTTRITAAAGNQICAYTIVVSMDSSMIVTEMDLSLSSNTIYVGNSVSAQLQVRPTSASNYATVALTSSNEKVATVNNFGRVTGIAPGTATITATCGSVTATTNVTVMSIPNSSTGTASMPVPMMPRPNSRKVNSPATGRRASAASSKDMPLLRCVATAVSAGVRWKSCCVSLTGGSALPVVSRRKTATLGRCLPSVHSSGEMLCTTTPQLS